MTKTKWLFFSGTLCSRIQRRDSCIPIYECVYGIILKDVG